jgi:hypothetical protein
VAGSLIATLMDSAVMLPLASPVKKSCPVVPSVL